MRLVTAGTSLALACAACATVSARDKELAITPTIASTVGALIAQRDRIQLSPAQVGRLEALENSLKAQLAVTYADLKDVQRRSRKTTVDDVPPRVLRPNEVMADRSPDELGMAGRGKSYGHTTAEGPPKVTVVNRILGEIDASDARAFADAKSQILLPAQLEVANRVAEDYAGVLFDYREARKRLEQPIER